MLVKELLRSPVTTCSIDTDVAAARDLMMLKHYSALPVVKMENGKARLMGIISYQDLVGVYDDNINVQQVMSTDVKVVSSETSIQEAARKMVEERIHHLIVKDEAIRGIISSFDFVKLIAGNQNILN